MSIYSIDSYQPYRPQLSLCSKLYQVTEIVAQIAVRILFVAASILAAAAMFPLSFHAVAIPIAGFGAAIISSFFFPQKRQIVAPLPPDSPRGLHNASQNCAFNSLVHFLESDPQIAHWLRHPLRADIDMAGFQNFMAGYHPTPRLMNDFAAYAAAQNPPRQVPSMFTDFLNAYVAPPEERHSFLNIKDVYRDIHLLHRTYSWLLTNYDQAMAENRPSLRGTQALRLAISQINPMISDSSLDQEDAPEILASVLNVLPNAHKMKIEVATHYEVGDHPIADLPDATSRKVEVDGSFTLALKPGAHTANLEEMFHHYCNEEIDTESSDVSVVRTSADGQQRRYKIDRRTFRILEAPTALRFQIKRQAQERELSSWYSWIIPDWFPVIGERQVKLETPVAAPEEMTITLASGERKTYRLASFINHGGSTPKSGHYTACRIVNGRKYHMNDASVSLIDQQLWEKKLRQAYLLCYLPVT